MRARRWAGGTILTALLLAPGTPAFALPATPPAAPDTAGPGAGACPARAGWTILTPATAVASYYGHGVFAIWIGVGADGALTWNGAPMTRPRMDEYFHVLAQMRPRPAIVINVLAGGDCATAHAVAAAADAESSCAPGACAIVTIEALPPMPPPAPPIPAPAPPPPPRPGT